MEDNRFKKDVADPDINIKKLDSIFEIDDSGEMVDISTGEIVDQSTIKNEVSEMRKELKDIQESLPDVDQIIIDNIDRANRFLDKIEEQVMLGNGTATMMESVGTLINAVTNAATSITGISYNNELLDIRRGELAVRERKATLEEMKKGNQLPSNVGGDLNIIQNTITLTREELLKELSKGD